MLVATKAAAGAGGVAVGVAGPTAVAVVLAVVVTVVLVAAKAAVVLAVAGSAAVVTVTVVRAGVGEPLADRWVRWVGKMEAALRVAGATAVGVTGEAALAGAERAAEAEVAAA